MSTQPKNVRLAEPILAALQEIAKRENKNLDEMANEVVMSGLSIREENKSRLTALMQEGHERAKKTHPSLNDDAVVEIVHAHRQQRGR